MDTARGWLTGLPSLIAEGTAQSFRLAGLGFLSPLGIWALISKVTGPMLEAHMKK